MKKRRGVEEEAKQRRNVLCPTADCAAATATGEGGVTCLGAWPVSGRDDLTGGRSMERVDGRYIRRERERREEWL